MFTLLSVHGYESERAPKGIVFRPTFRMRANLPNIKLSFLSELIPELRLHLADSVFQSLVLIALFDQFCRNGGEDLPVQRKGDLNVGSRTCPCHVVIARGELGGSSFHRLRDVYSLGIPARKSRGRKMVSIIAKATDRFIDVSSNASHISLSGRH